MNARPRVDQAIIVPRLNVDATARAWFDLSQTQRALAHRYKAAAMRWEAEGNHVNYLHCRTESDRLWRAAKAHLTFARRQWA